MPGEDNVYYRSVAVVAGTPISILVGDQVTVSENLTKDEVDRLKDNHPTLTFTAYAVQKDGIDIVADAWDKAPKN